jgi:hypothetical protein
MQDKEEQAQDAIKKLRKKCDKAMNTGLTIKQFYPAPNTSNLISKAPLNVTDSQKRNTE